MTKDIPILLIHGWGGKKEEVLQIKSFLKKKGFKIFYEFTYKENRGDVSLEVLSNKLERFIQEKVTEEIVNLIGVSQGGLIASNYILNFPQSKVIPNCFTICTPHRGSLLAYFLNRPGAIDLRPKSEFLNKLEFSFDQYFQNSSSDDRTNFFSIYTPFDLMVIPGWSANLKRSIDSKLVFSILHPLAIGSKQTMRFISENL